jgi:hypothetical protein
MVSAGDDGGVAADGGAALDQGPDQGPVGFGLEAAAGADRARHQVVGEHHAVADEDLVLNRHAVADEAVARDLAVRANHGTALHLDERADARVVADAAAIQVHQPRLGD